MGKPKPQTLFLGSAIAVAVAAVAYLVFFERNGEAGSTQIRSTANLNRSPFNGQASYEFLKAICEIGPRRSGSEGMATQQKKLSEHFRKLGGEVVMQSFDVRHPENGSRVTMSNMIVHWHPERRNRILLCAHYDTRPFPDSDPNPQRRRGTFIGANDGASGVALLCELGKHMKGFASGYGVDFVLFDGEEFVFDNQRDEYFLGSTHFARKYASMRREYRYRYAVLFDMVADRNLNLYMERHSLTYARALVHDIWRTARSLGIREFIQRSRHKVRDDHLPLNQIAKIPTCDIIDFDYPQPGAKYSYWHTEADTPDKCSAESLTKVGWVVLHWLKSLE